MSDYKHVRVPVPPTHNPDYESKRRYDSLTMLTASKNTFGGYREKPPTESKIVFIDEETGILVTDIRKFEDWMERNEAAD